MPRSRLKIVAKSVPAAKKKTSTSPEQSSPSLAKVSEFAPGDSVSHPKFGSGIVKEIDGDKLTIEFTGKITKQIVDYYVKRRAR
jgi:DNA helicase-2/ATP-dependent DNA helicase PcrA